MIGSSVRNPAERSKMLKPTKKCFEAEFQIRLLFENKLWPENEPIKAEWSYADSKWRSYIDWLPDVGTLTLPHNWSAAYENVIETIGLKEHIDDDRERMDQDFQLAMTFIKKNEKLFPYTDQEIREKF